MPPSESVVMEFDSVPLGPSVLVRSLDFPLLQSNALEAEIIFSFN